MPRSAAIDTRERILETAGRMFGDHGVHAVGVKQLVDAAGIGKNLFYREFFSKDDLVLSWLQHSDEQWWRLAETAMAPHAGDPARQALALVEFVCTAAAAPDYRGCVFYSASLEFRDRGHPAHREAAAHLERVRGRLCQLGAEAGAAVPETLAEELLLLIGGASVNAWAVAPPIPATTVLRLAALLVSRHCDSAAA
jgi:AcrR family transcriptional regulator